MGWLNPTKNPMALVLTNIRDILPDVPRPVIVGSASLMVYELRPCMA